MEHTSIAGWGELEQLHVHLDNPISVLVALCRGKQMAGSTWSLSLPPRHPTTSDTPWLALRLQMVSHLVTTAMLVHEQQDHCLVCVL